MLKKKVIVIGAGISGLIAARELNTSGIEVVVLDKARGAGGRMSTRRVEMGELTFLFDHGAQYISAHNERFQHELELWHRAGVIKIWDAQLELNPKQSARANPTEKPPYYVGINGMNAVTKYLSHSLHVQFNSLVTKISQSHLWQIETDTQHTYTADAILLTPPVPQSLSILAQSEISIDNSIERTLLAITYDPCIAVLIGYDGQEIIIPNGGLWLNGEPISWIGDNVHKGISKQSSITIHTGKVFSESNWKENDEVIVQDILKELAEVTNKKVMYAKVHRWRYGFATTNFNFPSLVVETPLPIVFAGDGFIGKSVEHAVLSGLSAAESLIKTLSP